MTNLSIDEKLRLYAASSVDRLKELHEGRRFHAMQLAVFNAVFRDGYKRIFIRKGRKGGGTETIMYLVCRVIGLIPNASAYIIGPTQTAQSEIIWDNRRIHNFIPSEWGPQPNEKDKRIRLNNQSFVKIEGADNPDRARGWEADIFVWDEFKDHNVLSLEACYPNLGSRDGIWVVLGTPPTIEDHHYYRQEQAALEQDDWACFHWSIWENEEFLPGGRTWIETEKARYEKEGKSDLWEIEYEAKYVFTAHSKVLPAFNDDNIQPRSSIYPYIKRDASHLKWVCSIDPGYATCFAVLFAAYNPYTAQITFLDEIYSKQRMDNSVLNMWPRILQKQKQLYDGRWITLYDSAAASFAVEVHAWSKERGLKASLEPTHKSPKDEDDYFRVANSIFAQEGLGVVTLECVHTIKEIKNYETDDKDEYPDKNNHQLDNMRYILKRLGYTQALAQGKAIKTKSNLPRAQKLSDYEPANSQTVDMVGFGGDVAGFDIDIHGGF